MGRYINNDSKGNDLPQCGKVEALLNDGAMEIPEPTIFQDGLVCVVDNGFFEAAAYAYCEEEMNDFKPTESDKRPRTWLYYKHANELSK